MNINFWCTLLPIFIFRQKVGKSPQSFFFNNDTSQHTLSGSTTSATQQNLRTANQGKTSGVQQLLETARAHATQYSQCRVQKQSERITSIKSTDSTHHSELLMFYQSSSTTLRTNTCSIPHRRHNVQLAQDFIRKRSSSRKRTS